MVWSYHCSETCFFIVFPFSVAFDHIDVGCPAGFKGNGLLLHSCSSYFLPGGKVMYPDGGEFTGRVLYAGWRLVLV